MLSRRLVQNGESQTALEYQCEVNQYMRRLCQCLCTDAVLFAMVIKDRKKSQFCSSSSTIHQFPRYKCVENNQSVVDLEAGMVANAVSWYAVAPHAASGYLFDDGQFWLNTQNVTLHLQYHHSGHLRNPIILVYALLERLESFAATNAIAQHWWSLCKHHRRWHEIPAPAPEWDALSNSLCL